MFDSTKNKLAKEFTEASNEENMPGWFSIFKIVVGVAFVGFLFYEAVIPTPHAPPRPVIPVPITTVAPSTPQPSKPKPQLASASQEAAKMAVAIYTGKSTGIQTAPGVTFPTPSTVWSQASAGTVTKVSKSGSNATYKVQIYPAPSIPPTYLDIYMVQSPTGGWEYVGQA